VGYMQVARKVVELGLARRAEEGIKVRQPLNELRIKNYKLSPEYLELIKDELNIKNIVCEAGNGDLILEIDATISPELKREGIKREIVRLINNLRKKAGLTINDNIKIFYQRSDKDILKTFSFFANDIQKDTLARSLEQSLVDDFDIQDETQINGQKIILAILKIK